MNVPLKFLLQSKMKAGVRRPKREQTHRPIAREEHAEHWTKRIPMAYAGPYAGPRIELIRPPEMKVGFLPVGVLQAMQKPLPSCKLPIRGNLLWQDYRFFVGAQQASSSWAKCRACREQVYGIEKIRDHMRRFKCTVLLVEAYKILNMHRDYVNSNPFKSKSCVVCGDKIYNKGKWGVPLCAKISCVENWMFDSREPHTALMVAISIARPSLQVYLQGAEKEWDEKQQEGVRA